MDESVIAAMARWPNVPAVFGWLSLSAQGRWKLHPTGHAGRPDASGVLPPGEDITSPPILSFINRNYAADSHGRWYFQNGPQRVYVRLDAAPYVLHLQTAPNGVQLVTHTGRVIINVLEWLLDEQGRVYVRTDLSGALLAGRDLPELLNHLASEHNEPLDTLWPDNFMEAITTNHTTQKRKLRLRLVLPDGTAETLIRPLTLCKACALPDYLGFVLTPSP